MSDDPTETRSTLARLRANADQVNACLRDMRKTLRLIADMGIDAAADELGREGVELLCRQACRSICIEADLADFDEELAQ